MNKYKLDQNKTPLFDAVSNYARNNSVSSFDVPGHKRGLGISNKFKEFVGENIFKMDPNSMKELDMLSNPVGVIKEAEELAADFYGADNAFFLVNGSTSGVQNMILSVCNENDKIIMPRNVHKSAINALVLSGAKAVFMEPFIEDDLHIAMGVSFEVVKKTIDENLDAKAIMLVSPTYFGVTSDVKKIADYSHTKGIAVLVDESHGSHFGCFEGVSENAMSFGADLATISVHKTGGSLTQSSILLHKGDLINRDKVRQIINLSQTSSASYLLLSSLDVARYELYKNKEKLNEIVEMSIKLINKINKLNGLNVLNSEIENGDSVYKVDPTKIVVDTTGLNLSGFKAYDILREKYDIQMELGETNVVLAVISVGDNNDTIDKLYEGFKRLSNDYYNVEIPKKKKFYERLKWFNKSNDEDVEIIKEKFVYELPVSKMSARKAFFSEKEFYKLEDSIGKISGDSIMYYPPGIPLVIPGEIISEDIISSYKQIVGANNVVLGTIEKENKIYISVVKENINGR